MKTSAAMQNAIGCIAVFFFSRVPALSRAHVVHIWTLVLVESTHFNRNKSWKLIKILVLKWKTAHSFAAFGTALRVSFIIIIIIIVVVVVVVIIIIIIIIIIIYLLFFLFFVQTDPNQKILHPKLS